jgi:ABC-type phosphate/phosphonate transport system substrate-binding protein/DNA-binding CsgD family transcriptional regulator
MATVIRRTKLIWQLLLVVWFFIFSYQIQGAEGLRNQIYIGVLAYDGKQQALTRWKPTADYLTRHILPRNFKIMPLTHEEFIHAINKDQLDFILTNPGHYIALEVKLGVTRIATFKSRFHEKILTQFSSIIFTRSDNNIDRLAAIKGRSMAAVSKQAFGGFQLAQSELLDHGINAYQDLNLLWLGFPQMDIVREVMAGRADTGTVRSGIVEKMAASGEINLSEIRVLGSRSSEKFPLLHSTALYPEWPIARLPNTDAKLAKQVAITLLQMPENAVPAIASGGAGWTIPLDYLNVHELFRKLQIEPYPPVPLELKEFWQAYRHWVFLLGFLFLISIFTIVFTLRINRQLKLSERSLSEHRDKLEVTIEQRTTELSDANLALQEDIESRIQFENTLHEGCETLQMMNTISNRHDLTREQRIQSIIDLARQYLGEELAVFSVYDGSGFEGCAYSPGNDNLPSPLIEQYARQALSDGQIIHFQNRDKWQSYVACNIYISDAQNGLLELATPLHTNPEAIEHKTALHSELGLPILHLFAQWVANELTLLGYENYADNQYQEVKSRFDEMTEREREVLQLVANGESNKSIARTLEISAKTVELHRSNLLRKTSSNSSVELVKLATQSKLVN